MFAAEGRNRGRFPEAGEERAEGREAGAHDGGGGFGCGPAGGGDVGPCWRNLAPGGEGFWVGRLTGDVFFVEVGEDDDFDDADDADAGGMMRVSLVDFSLLEREDVRESHGEDGGEEPFLRFAGFESPEQRDWLGDISRKSFPIP